MCDTSTQVVATLVPDDQRMTFLPRFFGNMLFPRGESRVYDHMRAFCKTYNGGYWEYYTLSNGGYFMAPKAENMFDLSIAMNGFEARVSPIAAGILVCLFVLGELANKYKQDHLIDQYHLLREYAADFPEARVIFRAID